MRLAKGTLCCCKGVCAAHATAAYLLGQQAVLVVSHNSQQLVPQTWVLGAVAETRAVFSCWVCAEAQSSPPVLGRHNLKWDCSVWEHANK